MSVDTLATVLIASMVVPATLFPVVYATRPWYRTMIGRALMTMSVGMALLVDISLLYRFFGDDYPGRDAVRLIVFGIIAAGLWYQFLALLATPKRHD